MNGKVIAGIVCLVIALALLISGIQRMMQGTGIAVTDGSGLGVSRAVGTFLPAILVAALGAWFLQKPKS